MKINTAYALIVCAGMAGFSCAAQAQELVYEPINPSFGGNPFNSSHLLAIANAQNDYDPPEEENSDVDRFIRSLQSRLLSSLSSQVAEAIFGEDAAESGRIVFGDQIIEFERTLDGIKLTITDADGSVTVVTVPYLVTDTDATGESALSGPTSLMATPLLAVPSDAGTSTSEQGSLLEPLGTVN